MNGTRLYVLESTTLAAVTGSTKHERPLFLSSPMAEFPFHLTISLTSFNNPLKLNFIFNDLSIYKVAMFEIFINDWLIISSLF